MSAIAVYVVMGWVGLARAGLLGGGHGVVRMATWVIAGFFLLGAAGNLGSRSRSERVVMTPIALVLASLTATVAALG